jgi:MOSC domain-containing protein YiiM
MSGEDADMPEGRIVAIFVAPAAGAPMEHRDEVEALAGVGLAGDRYATTSGTYSGFRVADEQRAVTLIEDEVITAVCAEHSIELTARETRRNLVTVGISLNQFVGREFRVGPVRLRGFDLAEPCAYLEGQTRPGVRVALAHRGGLRAEILDGGPIRVGDHVEPHPESSA